jgi:hypothetical protein
MKSNRVLLMAGIGLGLSVSLLLPPEAKGVSCPGGSPITVYVKNPTGGTVSGITVAGSAVSGQTTCTGQSTSYPPLRSTTSPPARTDLYR